MVDVFEEVEEQLRSDHYRKLALKTLPWVGGAIAAVLLAVGGWQGYGVYQTKTAAKASEAYALGLEAFEQGRTAEAQTRFLEVSKSPSVVYKALALQHLGGLKLTDRDVTGAVSLFDQSAKVAPDLIIGDAARLKSVYALLDTAPLKDIQARLDPLLKDGHPYRTEAREALAFAKIMAGDFKGARGDFVVVSLSPDAQQGARTRANAAMALIDSGSAKSVPAIVKATLALPAPTPMAPGSAVPGLMAQPPQGPEGQ